MKYLCLALALMCSVTVGVAANAKPKEPTAMSPQQKDARRAALVKTISQAQAVMDRYEKQSSFQKKALVTEAQYAAARERRARAQAERDSLAN